MTRRFAIDVDRIRCDGHGACAQVLPERIRLDDWGYPIVAAEPVTPELAAHARRAVASCPVQALALRRLRDGVPTGRPA